ncbi:hypothetical protein [Sporosarcina ureilytica]|uniref:hypothetical protein n=1 Tax=Sporosarcina ureilytica TaxID=298596 RepID=UPI0012DB10D3|nr:hypothetical protein [Sporosarcina ureilytica]
MTTACRFGKELTGLSENLFLALKSVPGNGNVRKIIDTMTIKVEISSLLSRFAEEVIMRERKAVNVNAV